MLRTPFLGPAVFLVSAAVLALQLILLRLFAIESFHHFAYMVVGIALLGFGASGTTLVLTRRWVAEREEALFELAVAGFPLALVVSVVLTRLLSLEPAQLLWDPNQWLLIAVLYALLTAPFLLAATAILLALRGAGSRVGRIYAWNMTGSGAGALLALAFLWARPDRALGSVVLLAACAGAGVLFVASRGATTRAWSQARRAGAVFLVLGGLVAVWRPPWALRLSPFKGLPQVEAYPDAQRVAEGWDPTGWVAAVHTPSFHHAPGLSLAYSGSLPPQTALFLDGATVGAATEWATPGDPTHPADHPALSFLDFLPTSAAYAARRPGSVLVLGSAGGLELLNALRHGADRVTAVELVGSLVRVAGVSTPVESDPYRRGDVKVVLDDGRAFAAAERGRFDLVLLPLFGGPGAAAAGVHAAGEDYLHTVEGYTTLLRSLAPGGILAITGWLRTPPRANVKAILTAGQALTSSGAGTEEEGNAFVFLRSWATGTLLVKPAGFGAAELERIETFTRERRIDVDWPPLPGRPAAFFNRIGRPVFREAAEAVSRGPEAATAFAREYPFHVEPATDDRPYFHRFLRLGSLRARFRGELGAWLPFAEWGYLAVVATLFQSAVLGLSLLALPAVALVRRAPAERAQENLLRVALYFTFIGFGFVFVEIAAIQRLALILGHPVYAAAATLGALLVFSGVGSAFSDQVDAGKAPRACLAAAALVLATALMSPWTGSVLSFPPVARLALATLLLGGLGFLMGWPFPTGLRKLTADATTASWAWAANGFSSVVGASMATIISMEIGGAAVLAAAALCYLGAYALARG